MALRKENAIRRTTQTRKGSGPRHTYIFKCAHTDCHKEISRRSDSLGRSSSYCSTHSHVKRPFESIYNGILQDRRWRGVPIDLTYEEYLEFTKIPTCHYCNSVIDWQPYGVVDGQYKSRAYYLDRKDSVLGYTKDNCVVCCTWCNMFRRNFLTYDEMKVAMVVITKLRAEKNPTS